MINVTVETNWKEQIFNLYFLKIFLRLKENLRN
jgi:hypothetical protein